MLERVEAEVSKVCRFRVSEDSNDPAHFARRLAHATPAGALSRTRLSPPRAEQYHARVRVNAATLATLGLAGAIWAAGAAPGCGTTSATLGVSCGDPCAAICLTSGDAVDEVCGTTHLATPCVGSGQMYCTRACSSDADCAGAPFEMRCLTACTNHPEMVGLCWSAPDWTSLRTNTCK